MLTVKKRVFVEDVTLRPPRRRLWKPNSCTTASFTVQTLQFVFKRHSEMVQRVDQSLVKTEQAPSYRRLKGVATAWKHGSLHSLVNKCLLTPSVTACALTWGGSADLRVPDGS